MDETPPVADLTKHLGYWLRFVSNHVSHAFARKVASKGVTVAEWVLMRFLHGRDGVAPSRLADEMGMTRGAITRLADRLVSKGLVLRKANADDGRAQTLSLTLAGVALVPELGALADENDAEFFGRLAGEERAALEATLRRLVEQVGMKSVPTG